MATSNETELPGARLERELRARTTPLLQLGGAVVKLESLRPSGGADDRGLAAWDALELVPKSKLAAAVSGGAALAAAGWARARGFALHAIIFGTPTHEVAETLGLWGASIERATSRADAEARLAVRSEVHLPELDGSLAMLAVARSLGAELQRQLDEAEMYPALIVAPAGAAAALAGSFLALRKEAPELRALALVAASAADVFPELPERAEAEAVFEALHLRGSVELIPVAREELQAARAELARSHGLSASHASAAAAILAQKIDIPSGQVAVALVTSTGEREFSLDPKPPRPQPVL